MLTAVPEPFAAILDKKNSDGLNVLRSIILPLEKKQQGSNTAKGLITEPVYIFDEVSIAEQFRVCWQIGTEHIVGTAQSYGAHELTLRTNQSVVNAY